MYQIIDGEVRVTVTASAETEEPERTDGEANGRTEVNEVRSLH